MTETDPIRTRAAHVAAVERVAVALLDAAAVYDSTVDDLPDVLAAYPFAESLDDVAACAAAWFHETKTAAVPASGLLLDGEAVDLLDGATLDGEAVGTIGVRASHADGRVAYRFADGAGTDLLANIADALDDLREQSPTA